MNENIGKQLRQIYAVHCAEAGQLQANLRKSQAAIERCHADCVLPALNSLAAELQQLGLEARVEPGGESMMEREGQNGSLAVLRVATAAGAPAFTFAVQLSASAYASMAGFVVEPSPGGEAVSPAGKLPSPGQLTQDDIAQAFLPAFGAWLRSLLPG